MISHTITDRDAGSRFNKYLTRLMPAAGSGFLYKMLRKKNITLNKAKAEGSEILKEGDTVEIFFSEETYEKFRGRQIETVPLYSEHPVKPESVVYEDNHVLIAYKPAGVLSQKDTSEGESINEMILQYLIDNGSVTAQTLKEFKPGICNRLDRNTPGLVLFGKTLPGGRELNRLLKERTLGKYYYAVVLGTFPKAIDSRLYLCKDTAANQVTVSDRPEGNQYVSVHTEITAVRTGKDLSLVRVRLHTGKSHQIRSVLSYLGYPVLGDPKYIPEGSQYAVLNQKYRQLYHLRGQMLLAYAVHFPKIAEGVLQNLSEKTFYAPLPKLFAEVASCELAKGEELYAVMEIPGTSGIVL
ncbi:MAG: RluA family pseudouridine synthase [Lachnospiraceae bacterium]|nr:RluA family pseudouridine synthase [Lachnospiraceae bacterium]